MPPGPESKLADPLLGRVVAGKFKIQELLGVGAMGRVYRAHHAALDKVIAIKVLNPVLGGDEGPAVRFKAEARAASRLDHANSVQILDFGEDGNDRLLYIAMELLQGQNLGALLKRVGRLSQLRAVSITNQVLGVLSAAQRAGVVHRDLKPANIMLVKKTDDDGSMTDFVKVCDFGIAKIMDSASPDEATAMTMTKQGAVFGTPAYMSPEQARGEKVDHRTDIFSAGVILYRMLAGKTPHSAETAMGVLTKLMTEEPQPLSSVISTIDPRLEEIVRRAMAKDRTQRYQSALDMRTALKELSQEGTLSASADLASPQPGAEGNESSDPPVGRGGSDSFPPQPKPGTIPPPRSTIPPPGRPTVPPGSGRLATLPPSNQHPVSTAPPPEARNFRTMTQTGWTRTGSHRPVDAPPTPGFWQSWRKPIIGLAVAGALSLAAWPLYRAYDKSQALAKLESQVSVGAFGVAENLLNDRFESFSMETRALDQVDQIMRLRREAERYESRGMRFDPSYQLAPSSWSGTERLPEIKRSQRFILTLTEVDGPLVRGHMDWPDSGFRAAIRGFRSGNQLVLWDYAVLNRPTLVDDVFRLNDKKILFIDGDRLTGWDGPYQATMEGERKP